MSLGSELQAPRFDTLKWLLVIAIVIIGISGNYWYTGQFFTLSCYSPSFPIHIGVVYSFPGLLAVKLFMSCSAKPATKFVR